VKLGSIGGASTPPVAAPVKMPIVTMIISGSDRYSRTRNALCSQSCPKIANAPAPTAATTATRVGFHPNALSNPSPSSTVSTMLNAR
jgi:hypothetical protein